MGEQPTLQQHARGNTALIERSKQEIELLVNGLGLGANP